MTDRDVVDHVARLFGRAVVRLRRRKPHHKLPYATTIKGAPAAQVMYAVKPFLSKTRRLSKSIVRSRRGKRGGDPGTEGDLTVVILFRRSCLLRNRRTR